MNPYSEFTCLYTSQKLKKAKTWQDGHLRYFHTNSKVVLYDTKFSVLDSTFHRGATIAVGDDMDMDKHLITIEDLTAAYATNSADQRTAPNPAPATSTIRRNVGLPSRATPARASMAPPTVAAMGSTATSSSISISGSGSATTQQPENNTQHTSWSAAQSDAKRKKWSPPVPGSGASASTSLNTADDDWDFGAISAQDLQDTFNDTADGLQEPPAIGTSITTSLSKHNIRSAAIISTTTSTSSTLAAQNPTPKRRRVGLSKLSSSSSSVLGQSSLKSPHRPPSTQLEFPNAARCTNFTGKNSSQLLRRSLALGSRFMTTNQYKDGMSFLIYEHIQILVIEIAIAMWKIKANPNTREGEPLDALYRSRGIHMHSASSLRRRGDAYAGFPSYSERAFKGAGDISGGGGNVAAVQTTSQQGAALSITNKEHHSKYSKDDLWVVSTTPRFDASSTFFARSVFYGPSGSDVDLLCLSPKDSSKARDIFTNSTGGVCAIRLFNAMSEFMMLDNLSDSLTRTSLLPVLLNYVPPELIKASKTSIFKPPSRVPEKSGCIVLTEEDGIDIEMEIHDTIDQHRLNQEQAMVLRNFAQTVIRAPGWTQMSVDVPPVLLVHGVFGAGKSFLIAVLIVFIDNIISKARPLPREERSCRFLVASMTNVAVDRILMALLDLNYTKFVRVGSLKKVARRVLPYTAQSTGNRTAEEIKELQSILDDDSLSIKERQYVKDAMKRFQKLENRGIVEGANVVGATCIASTFEVLDGVSFPIVILDEASQLLEPMSLIPICRASAEKLIMVGDPLQLSPPVNTNENNSSAGKGLSRTLFDRSAEMGIKPVMLRTQYRCHQRIAEISNTLFYSNVLQTGATPSSRAPLIEGLPTLTFIDNVGQEIQNTRTKSFTNPAEVRLVVSLIQRLLSLNIPEANIGVISLYKSQADSIQSELSEQLKNSGLKGSVQISTVDAFQGSEKDVIIVSTVRTDSIGFIDNHQRVNVALTRSKRHLFLVGNSPLLSSNSVWGPIIRDHCSGAPDGFMRGDQFAQRLKSLTPLPRQVEVEEHAVLSDSEDEVENDREDEGQDDDDYDEPNEDHDGYGYASSDSPYGRTAPESTRPSATARTYMLYEADEDDSGQSNDEQETEVQTRRETASYLGGGGGLPQRTAYDQNLGVIGTHSTGADVAPFSAPSNQRHNSRPIPEPQPQDSAHLSSLEGFSQLEGVFDGDVVSSYSLPEKNTPVIKKEPVPAEDNLEEEEEKVLWEDDDEDDDEDEGEDQDVRGIPTPEHRVLFQDNAFSTMQHQPDRFDLTGIDRGHSRQTPVPVLGMGYESQGIEDLDVAGWSQLATSTAKESVGGGESEALTRDSDDLPKKGLLFESGGNEDEDDISCLEVGNLDMI